MIAYTGIETISNMAEEAKDEEQDDPGRDQPRRDRRVRRSTPRCRPSRCQRAAGHPERRRHLPDAARPDRGAGRLRRRPDPRRRQALDLGFLQQPAEIYVGMLAATILFIATNAGIIGVSRLVYSMGLHRQMPDRLRRLHPKYGTPWIGILDLRRDRLHRHDPGPGRLPRQHVRVRRDAVVHDRARVGHPAAGHAARRGSGPTAGRANVRDPRLRRAGVRDRRRLGTSLAFIVVTPCTSTWRRGHGVGWPSRHRLLHRLPPRPGPRPHDDDEGRACPRPSSSTRPSTSRSSSRSTSSSTPRAPSRRRSRLAARRRRGIHVLVTIPVPASSPIDAEMPEQELAAQAIIEQARIQGGRRVSGHYEKVRAGQAGRDDRQRGARHARAGGRHARCPRGPADRCSARRSRPCSPSARAA